MRCSWKDFIKRADEHNLPSASISRPFIVNPKGDWATSDGIRVSFGGTEGSHIGGITPEQYREMLRAEAERKKREDRTTYMSAWTPQDEARSKQRRMAADALLSHNPSSDPDIMLGQRMNPIMIAPTYAVLGGAPGVLFGGLPSTGMSAVGQSLAGLGMAYGMEELTKYNPDAARIASASLLAAPLVAPTAKAAVGATKATGRLIHDGWNNFRWRNYPFRVDPRVGPQLDKVFEAARRYPKTPIETLETILARKALENGGGLRDPADYSRLLMDLRGYSEAKDWLHRKDMAPHAMAGIDYLYSMGRKKHGKPISFREVIEQLPEGGEYVFKGGSSYNDHGFRPDEYYWLTHNPAVGAGYSYDLFRAFPVKDGRFGAVSSRFTPHIASADPKKIEAARAKVVDGFGARSAGSSSAGNAYDYEAPLTGREIGELLDKPIIYRAIRDRKPPIITEDSIPVLHGRDLSTDFNPGKRFYRVDNLAETYAPSSGSVVDWLLRYAREGRRNK